MARDKDIDYRHKLSKEDKEWMDNFEKGLIGRRKSKLENICEDDSRVTRIIKEEEQNRNVERRDIMNTNVRIRPKPEDVNEYGYDEAFEIAIAADNLDLEPEVIRKRDDGNYTAEDYSGSDFPSEDLLIAMIDHDKAIEESKKIKDFMAAKAKKEKKF